jgi:hypothetical protein
MGGGGQGAEGSEWLFVGRGTLDKIHNNYFHPSSQSLNSPGRNW